MNPLAAQRLYKVASRTAWEEACRTGAFSGSPDDERDGYIHLSHLQQLQGTFARHFKGQTDLVLVALESSELGAALKWEPSRNGELFPHLYAPLPTRAARAVYSLHNDADGVPLLPAEL
jgi:uncharacterized protein (DUF952 family)